MVFAIVLGSTLIPTKAEESIELSETFNVNFVYKRADFLWVVETLFLFLFY